MLVNLRDKTFANTAPNNQDPFQVQSRSPKQIPEPIMKSTEMIPNACDTCIQSGIKLQLLVHETLLSKSEVCSPVCPSVRSVLSFLMSITVSVY